MVDQKKELIVHNGRLCYTYVLNNQLQYSIRDLIETLAKEAGYNIIHQGNGQNSWEEDVRRKKTSYYECEVCGGAVAEGTTCNHNQTG